MVDTLNNKMNAVTKMQEVSQMVDDPEWKKNNDKRLDLEAKINQEQWKIDTAQKTIEDLTPKREGIRTRMLVEDIQLYRTEKSWGGIGKWLFSKDIQKRKELKEELLKKFSDYDEKITKAKTIIWNGGDYIPYLKNERDNLIKKEEAIIESYHQQAGLEINIDSSVADRRSGTINRPENNIDNSVADRRAGVVIQAENNIENSVADRRAGVVIQTENNIDDSVANRRAGMVNRPENNIENSVADRRAGVVIQTKNNIENSAADRRTGVVTQTKNNIENNVTDRRTGTIIQTENELKKISNIKKQGVNNNQSNQQPNNNRRKVVGDRSK